jgi:predicted class III extradiol MEMO1 family dioxygenase
MERLRRAAVSGSWYPREPARLSADVERYCADAVFDPVPAPRAVIAPHAGLMYSGAVAGFAYQAARGARYGTIVLVGPSHFVPFQGVSVWSTGAWQTPFGDVSVDERLASAIAAVAPEVLVDRADAHDREHSLELQLPFVAHLWPEALIVPLVMGRQSRATAFALGNAIAVAVAARNRAVDETSAAGPHSEESAGHGDVLLVASSDLSHYEDAVTAASMDAVVMRHVEAFDADGLMHALERQPRHACGGGPMVSILHAARQLGATRARLLQRGDSGDVSGDKSAVVGYLAAAMW